MLNKKINTKYITVDPFHPESGPLEEGGSVLRRGGLVAFPTETVYGLGANALDGRAVAGIFAAKGRPQDNPLIVHVAGPEAVGGLVKKTTGAAEALMNAFWPGPLTIILPVGEAVPAQVTAGLGTVAVRMPAHPVALGLLRAAGVPVAAPSANTSGRPSPTTARHVLSDLAGRIDLIIDGGPAGVGVESTVVDLTVPVPLVLRPGGITPEDLSRVLDAVAVDPAARSGFQGKSRPRSPGMKYTHYAPRAPLFLIEGEVKAAAAKIMDLAKEYRARGCRVGILAYKDGEDFSAAGEVVTAGRRDRPETVAAALYATLRRFDEMEVDVILAEGLADQGIGLAVMNRLRKAAGGKIIRV
ncbi:threonylcarbamoyl-AMP synthase [Pelotomaculum terephthalicicum JT]|uniref:L-threonylcarbamoyladenylate synthase n=1 Tax=Pelotomaculum TaxID=191373 RepID=UPI0009C5C936|nr:MULTISPECIES: L-threonylcarbamoyladenylate synthase [Pelotomaculum]MCG9967912.1 threonylcarbamoyl-AMP synthase [Pelotomaculum terephthalicicum JT]OPX90958.1 MAG: Threonylcarbamoyl-AMP synthase [Pelotomaculum sp. PtaB.Bin117]OPY62489.1 MAG: Threonylcarbamoyl-AMP synthase [Pelotomaculum sp. PtaU1.Bin065]